MKQYVHETPTPEKLDVKKKHYDVAVVGGGMSGLCAAIASARQGARTVLIQDRGVFGGNASSEMRMHISGASCHWGKKDAAETGILMELQLENKNINDSYNYSIWDGVLWHAAKEPLELVYTPTGQRILFRGLDNVEKLASTTVERGYLCWVWIEEAYELALEADFDKLDLSVPRGELPKPLFKQTTITFNPWDENHWLKGRFFDGHAPDVYAVTTDYRCNEFLDGTDRGLYERMREQNPRKYAVAGLGEWGHSEGLVFENWVVEEFSLRDLRREGLRHVYGLDYGYTNDPTAFIAAAVDEAAKRIYLYDEHYQRRMLNEDIAAMIVEKGYQKERIRADAAEPKSNEDLRRLGIGRLQAANKGRDSVLSGISRLQEYRLVVHPRCVHTAAELRGYVWQADGRDGVYRNLPCDKDNHLMDALRYAMEDVPRPPVGQERVRQYGLPRGGWKG